MERGRHFVFSFCAVFSFLLSVGNRFLVSIQQQKMSLSGGTESDEYIHLYSAVLCSGLSAPMLMQTKTYHALFTCVGVCACV